MPQRNAALGWEMHTAQRVIEDFEGFSSDTLEQMTLLKPKAAPP